NSSTVLVLCPGLSTFAFCLLTIISMFHQRDFVDIRRASRAEDADDDCQPHRSLGRRRGDDQECDRMSLHIVLCACEGQKRQVRGVEHELDAHQHDQRIAPPDYAAKADAEQDRRQHQKVPDRDHDATFASFSLSWWWRATTSAPTTATRS